MSDSTLIDEFNTAGCPRCVRRNDAGFRRHAFLLQAADFGDPEARAELALLQLPAVVASLSSWLVEVDRETSALVSLEHDQLPAWYWADAHTLGLTPHEAAHFAVQDAHEDAIAELRHIAGCLADSSVRVHDQSPPAG